MDRQDRPASGLDRERPSAEVGSEGGSPGDVELDQDDRAGTGSEAGETWRPAEGVTRTIHRDETGAGRRSPND